MRRSVAIFALLCSGLWLAAPAAAQQPAGAEALVRRYRQQQLQKVRLIHQLKQGTAAQKVAAAQRLAQKPLEAAAPALIEALAGPPRLRQAAEAALVALGVERALPALRATLETGARPLRPHAARVLGRYTKHRSRVVALLCRALLADQHRATRLAALAALRSTDVAAVPALLGAWQQNRKGALDARFEEALVRRLRAMGARMLPQLRAALQADDLGLAVAAATLLPLAGRSAAAEVARALQHDHPEVRQAAASAAPRIDDGAALGLLVPRLAASLRGDASGEVRAAAAASLGVVGERATAATPSLLASLKDRSALVRRAAAEALARVPVDPVRAADALRPLLADRDTRSRAAAIRTLASFGAAAAAAMPKLLELIEDHHLGRLAIDAIGRIGGGKIRRGSQEAAATLRRVLATGLNGPDRAASARALGRLRPASQANVGSLLRALRDDADRTVQREAATALGAIGPRAASAAAELIAVIDSVGCDVGDAAAKALGLLGRRAVGPLRRALLHENPRVVAAAVAALGAIGPAAAPALRRLVRLLGAASTQRTAAAKTIGQIGRRAAIAVPALIAAIDREPRAPLAGAAIVALGRIGPGAARAIPTLLRAIGSRTHVAAAARALGQIGLRGRGRPSRRLVIEALRGLLRDQQPAVRQAAAGALDALGESHAG